MTDVRNIQNLPELSELLGKEERVLVSFGAPSWCIPCKRLAPHFANLASQIEDATFVEVDIDKSDDIKNNYGIQSVPTVLYFRHGFQTETITSRTVVTLKRELQEIEDKQDELQS